MASQLPWPALQLQVWLQSGPQWPLSQAATGAGSPCAGDHSHDGVQGPPRGLGGGFPRAGQGRLHTRPPTSLAAEAGPPWGAAAVASHWVAEPVVDAGASHLAAGPKPACWASCREGRVSTLGTWTRGQGDTGTGHRGGTRGSQAGPRSGRQALTVLAAAAREAGAAQAGSGLRLTGGTVLARRTDLLAAEPPATLRTI